MSEVAAQRRAYRTRRHQVWRRLLQLMRDVNPAKSDAILHEWNSTHSDSDSVSDELDQLELALVAIFERAVQTSEQRAHLTGEKTCEFHFFLTAFVARAVGKSLLFGASDLAFDVFRWSGDYNVSRRQCRELEFDGFDIYAWLDMSHAFPQLCASQHALQSAFRHLMRRDSKTVACQTLRKFLTELGREHSPLSRSAASEGRDGHSEVLAKLERSLSPPLSPHEQILAIRGNCGDITNRPPIPGTLVVTSRRVAFLASVVATTQSIRITDMSAVLPAQSVVFRTNTALTVQTLNRVTGTTSTRTFDLYGAVGLTDQRDELLHTVDELRAAHALAERHCARHSTLSKEVKHLVRRTLVARAAADICVHTALTKALPQIGRSLRATFFAHARSEKVLDGHAVLVTQACESAASLSNEAELCLCAADIADIVLVRDTGMREDFSFETLLKQWQLLQRHVRPLICLQRGAVLIRDWRYPPLSWLCLYLLLSAAYYDRVQALLGLTFLMHALFLALLHFDPSRFERFFLRLQEYVEDVAEEEETATEDVRLGVINRARAAVVKGKNKLQRLQHRVEDANVALNRARNVYLWSDPDSSFVVLALSSGTALLLLLLPFRLLFAAAVLHQFTRRWRSESNRLREFAMRISSEWRAPSTTAEAADLIENGANWRVRRLDELERSFSRLLRQLHLHWRLRTAATEELHLE